MKTKLNKSLIVHSGVVLTFALALLSPTQTCSAEPSEVRSMSKDNMGTDCQQMMTQHDKLMSEMKAQDAELTAQVAKMESAPLAEKTALLATIVTRLVEQRAARDGKMEKMHTQMMAHMMQHMEAGKESMAQCPMMKTMGEMGSKSSDEPMAHSMGQK